jgi:multicomponent Na+:H+ antiporter subunit C
VSLLLAVAAAVLFGLGTYLVLQRTLSRIIIGIGLLSHGANVLWILAGRRGTPPIVGNGPSEDFSDPVPQALTLTAIVITFGVTAFLLALAYRSWVLTDDDEVEHDLADIAIRLGRGPEDDDDDGGTAEEAAGLVAGGTGTPPVAEPGRAATAPPPDPAPGVPPAGEAP